MKKIYIIISFFLFCLFELTAQSNYKTIINFNLDEINIKETKIFIEIFQPDNLINYKTFQIIIPKKISFRTYFKQNSHF